MTPANLKRTMTNPSIMSSSQAGSGQESDTPGYRAAEAYVRPAPITAAGTITRYHFDLKRCEFNMTLKAPKAVNGNAAPTVVLLPEYHYPKDSCIVEVTSGKWEIASDEDEGGVLLQRLKWWHGDGEQTIRITGQVRKYNSKGGDEGVGYYETLSKGAGNCVVM